MRSWEAKGTGCLARAEDEAPEKFSRHALSAIGYSGPVLGFFGQRIRFLVGEGAPLSRYEGLVAWPIYSLTAAFRRSTSSSRLATLSSSFFSLVTLAKPCSIRVLRESNLESIF